jgi:hypothetical protein
MRRVHKDKFIDTMLTIYGLQKTEKQRRELLFRMFGSSIIINTLFRFDLQSIGRIKRADMKIILYHIVRVRLKNIFNIY